MAKCKSQSCQSNNQMLLGTNLNRSNELVLLDAWFVVECPRLNGYLYCFIHEYGENYLRLLIKYERKWQLKSISRIFQAQRPPQKTNKVRPRRKLDVLTEKRLCSSERYISFFLRHIVCLLSLQPLRLFQAVSVLFNIIILFLKM